MAPMSEPMRRPVRTIRYRAGQVYFAGRWLSLWDSYDLARFELRAGNFSEDSRGRWYLNVCVPVAQRDAPGGVLQEAQLVGRDEHGRRAEPRPEGCLAETHGRQTDSDRGAL